MEEILAKIGVSFSLPLGNVAAEWEGGKLGINKHMEWLFWDSISEDKMSFFGSTAGAAKISGSQWGSEQTGASTGGK